MRDPDVVLDSALAVRCHLGNQTTDSDQNTRKSHGGSLCMIDLEFGNAMLRRVFILTIE
jgi:hypothetical protein